MGNNGVVYPDFLGFGYSFDPTTTNSFAVYMECFATSGVTGLYYDFADIPQTGDRQYLFDQIVVPQNTVPYSSAWYTFFIPQDSIGSSTNRLTQIEQGTSSSYGTTYTTEPNVYNYGLVTYTGSVFENTTYRVYTTWGDPGLNLDNTINNLYFRGGGIS